MKTRYRIIIPIVAVLIVFTFFYFYFLENTLVMCDGQILNIDQCNEYFNEKYKAIPTVNHFLNITDSSGLGMRIENFQASPMFAATTENNLLVHMEIDPKTDIIIYRCIALEDSDNIFVEIENPTIEDINDNRCSSFDSSHLKSHDDLKCEQIGGNPNHPEYEWCVIPSIVCKDHFKFEHGDECQTGSYLCEDLGGTVINTLSCKESVEVSSVSDPAPCDFRGSVGCEFRE